MALELAVAGDATAPVDWWRACQRTSWGDRDARRSDHPRARRRFAARAGADFISVRAVPGAKSLMDRRHSPRRQMPKPLLLSGAGARRPVLGAGQDRNAETGFEQFPHLIKRHLMQFLAAERLQKFLALVQR